MPWWAKSAAAAALSAINLRSNPEKSPLGLLPKLEHFFSRMIVEFSYKNE